MNDLFVFDTNTLISAFLFPKSIPRKALDKGIESGKLVLSTKTYTEFKKVILRPKFDKYLSPGTKQKALKELNSFGIFIETTERITACRDPKDDKFLELAVAAKASCIITGDDDLLVLHPFRNIPIFNPSDFLKGF